MDDINKAIDKVRDPEGLAVFLQDLRRDPYAKEIVTVDDFLERLSRFLVDASQDGGYLGKYGKLPGRSWAMAADVVFSAFVYE